MSQQGKVTKFIRVHGRVVPVRAKSGGSSYLAAHKQQIEGGAKRAALIGSGFALAGYAGHLAGGLEVKGAQALNAGAKEAAEVIFKSRAALLGAGLLVGGALVAKGVASSDKKTKFDLRSKAIGFAASGAAAAGYYKALSPGLKTRQLAKLAVEKSFGFARKLKP